MNTPQRQRGSMAIVIAILLTGLIFILGLVTVAQYYWAKRDAQKVADLAALSGVQQLPANPSLADCAKAKTAAKNNAITNFRTDKHLPVAPDCGTWIPASGSSTVEPNSDSIPNAVKVRATVTPDTFFGTDIFGKKLSVSAVAVAAKKDPIATFWVGSQLLRIKGQTPLGNVLKLVGVDLDETTLIGYDGLAQVKITPGGLLEALGIPVNSAISVGDLNGLLAAKKVSLGELLDAAVLLAQKNGFANVDLSVLRQALKGKISLDEIDIPLGSETAQGGSLFAHIQAPTQGSKSALDANINVLSLITTGISIAAHGHALEVGHLNALGLVNVKAAIMEPPSIVIGGIGSKANNAQIRLLVDIDTKNLLGGALNSLIRVHIPIYIDTIRGIAELESVNCNSTPHSATFITQSKILHACIGKIDENNEFSGSADCETHLEDEQLINLLGIKINDHRVIDGLTTSPSPLTVDVGETESTSPNRIRIGETLEDIVTAVLGIIDDALEGNSQDEGSAASSIAKSYLEATKDGGRYDIDAAIDILSQEPDPSSGQMQGLGDWTVNKGVPHSCAILFTCWEDGSVWEGLEKVVKGQGQGLVGGLLGTVLGGVVLRDCNGLISQLLTYNSCVQSDLAYYLQTAPEGVLNNSSSDDGGSGDGCGILCILVKPVLDILKPVLNSLGSSLSELLTNTLGLELGRTDVHLESLQCPSTRLVY